MLFNPKLMNQIKKYLPIKSTLTWALNTTTDKDSLYKLALNGADGKFGFLDIIDNYEVLQQQIFHITHLVWHIIN